MPVFKPRNRLVNFRLSEDEFEKLKASSSLNDARSLSDFARAAVMRAVAELANPDARSTSLATAVDDRRITELESRIEQMTKLMEALRAAQGERVESRLEIRAESERS
jgi:hypothetical protein